MDNAQLVNLFKESTKNYSSDWGSAALIGEWLDEGQIDIILRTKCYTDTKTLTSVASQREYSIGTDVLQILHVMFNNGEVEPATIQELQFYNNYPSETAGTPTHFYVKMLNNPLMGFSPPPSTGSLNITLHYLKRPPNLTTTSNDPVIPEAYHRLIVRHALHHVLLKDAKFETRQAWWKEYENTLNRMVVNLRNFTKQRAKQFTPFGHEHKGKNMKVYTGDI